MKAIARVFAFLGTLTLAASASGSGLTLSRYNNTALVGGALDTAVVTSLENMKAFESGTTPNQPAGLLITGRLAPPKAGRYGFEVTFTPEIPYPSSDAYARLWVDDHQLYPLNSTIKFWGKGITPKWCVAFLQSFVP
jgi:hypothetical protein